MTGYIEKMKKNPLFQGLSEADFKTLLEPDACIFGSYGKNTVIMQENEPCSSMGFVLEGTLTMQQISVSGEIVKIEVLHAGSCFGLFPLFSANPVYPYTVVTSSFSSVLYIPFERVSAALDESPAFRNNYIAILSNRVQTFQQKIRILSQKDVRSRLILYLSGEAMRIKSTHFTLPHSKTEIADLIGVARPSVSRELRKMQEDGLIELERNTVTLKRQSAFNLRLG